MKLLVKEMKKLKLNELKLLIETDQINEICFHAESLEIEQGFVFTIFAKSNNANYSRKLKTGRTSQDKTYSSIDRALKAMLNLGYKGEYRIVIKP